MLSLILLLNEIDHDSIGDNEPHEKFHTKFQDFQSKKSTFNLCKISLKFWLYMYLFSSPSVPLLIEQVLNVYLLQTIVHFMGGKRLWWSSTSSAGISDGIIPVPGGQTSFKCINIYNFIFGMYFVLFRLNIMKPTSFSWVSVLTVTVVVLVWPNRVHNTSEHGPTLVGDQGPWLIWHWQPPTSQHRHSRLPYSCRHPHIFWSNSEPTGSNNTAFSNERNIPGWLACWFFMGQRCIYHGSWWTMLRHARPLYKCDQLEPEW